MEEVLEINNLYKQYGKHTVAVDGLSLTIKKGDVFGLLGPNGSGKTTTLAVIMDIIKQQRGTYSWFGQYNVWKVKKRIGSLIETPNFYPYLTVCQNLQIVSKIKGVADNDIGRVLHIVNLVHKKNSKYNTLSLGMKQRLAIASLLLGDPEVLVLDEPANGLDPEGIAEVRNIITSEALKNKTIILASHILDEVEKVCSSVGILKKGKLIATGNVRELLAKDDLIIISADRIGELYELIVRAGVTKTIEKYDNELALTLNENFSCSGLNELAFNNGFVLSKLEIRKKSLESQFLEIVK